MTDDAAALWAAGVGLGALGYWRSTFAGKEEIVAVAFGGFWLSLLVFGWKSPQHMLPEDLVKRAGVAITAEDEDARGRARLLHWTTVIIALILLLIFFPG